jgi:hypothetical protein
MRHLGSSDSRGNLSGYVLIDCIDKGLAFYQLPRLSGFLLDPAPTAAGQKTIEGSRMPRR